MTDAKELKHLKLPVCGVFFIFVYTSSPGLNSHHLYKKIQLRWETPTSYKYSI